MINFKKISFVFVLLLFTATLFTSCFISCTSKDDDPVNPYDSVNYDVDTTTHVIPDPISITGLHKNIFSTKCALPGCHDGHFEPDFRSVQSSFSTLVWQTTTKKTVNNVDTFQYRVIPYDVAHSFIHERVTTSTTEYMPSNGTRLTQEEIDQIDAWIMNGAKDADGNVAPAPNNQPNIIGYVAYDLSVIRLDTIRKDGIPYNPFVVQQNQTFNIIFVIQDDSTAASQLMVNQVKLSTDQDDFSGAITVNAVYSFLGLPYWYVTVNSNQWSQGQTIYFRYYVNDGDHTTDVEFPKNESLFYLKSIFAFYVQ